MDQFAYKLFLLCSHIAFFLPIGYLFTRKHIHVFIHLFLLFSTMVTSFLYHYCDLPALEGIDRGYLGLHYCLVNFQVLYALDFQLAALTAINLCSYHMSEPIRFVREIVIVMTFILTSYIYGFLKTFNDLSFYILMGSLVIILLGSRGYGRYKQYAYHANRWWLPIEGTKPYAAILSFLCLSGGFVCFAFDMNDYYFLIHACWHIFCAVGVFFGFLWIDSFKEMMIIDDNLVPFVLDNTVIDF